MRLSPSPRLIVEAEGREHVSRGLDLVGLEVFADVADELPGPETAVSMVKRGPVTCFNSK